MTSEEVRKILNEEYDKYREREKEINEQAIEKWQNTGWSETYASYMRNWIEVHQKQNAFQFVYALVERGIV